LIYPNPFREETKIEFSIQKADQISLSVYDAKGILVRRLLNRDPVPEGKFEIIWDGRDSYGSNLPGGVYFYSIQGESGAIMTGKMILSRS
jgi:flagellar hook assembly protein FlgD